MTAIGADTVQPTSTTKSTTSPLHGLLNVKELSSFIANPGSSSELKFSASVSASVADRLKLMSRGFSDPFWVPSPPEHSFLPSFQWDRRDFPEAEPLNSLFVRDSLDDSSVSLENSSQLPVLWPWNGPSNLGIQSASNTCFHGNAESPNSLAKDWSTSVIASLLEEEGGREPCCTRGQSFVSTESLMTNNTTTSTTTICSRPTAQLVPHHLTSLHKAFSWLDAKEGRRFDMNTSPQTRCRLPTSAPLTRVPSGETDLGGVHSSNWRASTPPTPRRLKSFQETVTKSTINTLTSPMNDIFSSSFRPQRSAPPGLFPFKQLMDSSSKCLTNERSRLKSSRIRYTNPGEITCISPSCAAILPALRSPEALAPLHIVLPINLPYGKVIIAQNTTHTVAREHPLHHYYFQAQFPSANNLFSRLHGLCNQSPSWLALDIGKSVRPTLVLSTHSPC